MTPHALKKLDRELSEFIAEMTDAMGRPERRAAMGHWDFLYNNDAKNKSAWHKDHNDVVSHSALASEGVLRNWQSEVRTEVHFLI